MGASRVALVTGASSGIGRAVALRLATKGWRVGCLARRRGPLEAVAQEVTEAGGEATVLTADVADPDAVGGAVEELVARWKRVDVLVNNAGIGEGGAVEAVTDASLHRQFSVNVYGALYCTRAVVPHMKEQGGGQIVNMGSMAGVVGIADLSVYVATKWALRGFNEAWREELYPHGIKVAYVAPGYVLTAFGGDTDPQAAEWALAPEDVAHTVEGIIEQGANADVKEVLLQVLDRS